MTTTVLSELFRRDLDRLIEQIGQFDSDEQLWVQKEGINNTAGNLCMHLLGNLQHFIGHVIGRSDYERDRKAEFETEFKLRTELLAEIEICKKAIDSTLTRIPVEQLQQNYPLEVFGKPMTTGWFLMHLYGHLNYHLGQIDYYRRLS